MGRVTILFKNFTNQKMNKTSFISSLAILTVLIFSNCKTSKKTGSSAAPIAASSTTVTVSSILKKWEANEIKAEWLAGDVETDYQGKPMNIAVNMNVRFRRDSIIWINVKKLGFNVARAKITPDSVFVLNYIQNNYVAESLKYIETKFNLPADFNLLQNLMLGNPIFLTDKNQLKLEKSPTNNWIMTGKNAQWQAAYTLDEKAEILKEMNFEQPFTERSMKITYENYNILRGYESEQKKFPYLRTLNVESPQTGKIAITLEVDNDGLEINAPKALKFEIPTHYDRVR